MKHLITLALTLTLGLINCAPLNAADSDTKTTSKTLNISIKGMTCQGCANGVTAALKKLKGVNMAKVDFSKESGSINYLLDETNEKQIIKTIEKSGYKVSVKKGDKEEPCGDDCSKVKSKKSS